MYLGRSPSTSGVEPEEYALDCTCELLTIIITFMPVCSYGAAGASTMSRDLRTLTISSLGFSSSTSGRVPPYDEKSFCACAS